MKARIVLFTGATILAACTNPPPVQIQPPPPGNQPRINTQVVCHEVWTDPTNGQPFNVIYWKWSTGDGNAHVQVQDVTNTLVLKDFIIPLGGGEFYQRLTQGYVGRIMWESSPGGWTPVALFPDNIPLPDKCGWAVPPV